MLAAQAWLSAWVQLASCQQVSVQCRVARRCLPAGGGSLDDVAQLCRSGVVLIINCRHQPLLQLGQRHLIAAAVHQLVHVSSAPATAAAGAGAAPAAPAVAAVAWGAGSSRAPGDGAMLHCNTGFPASGGV